MAQQILYSQNIGADLDRLCAEIGADKIFMLTDETTHKTCLPVLADCEALKAAEQVTIGVGDPHKTICSLSTVWQLLSERSATRHSLLLCLGGGMVTDLGGFAAATFKRGITFVNIPTTLLSMVDAAVGGKTGINFNGLKNEVGAFCEARSVLISTDFLRTLDAGNLRSGYAEMLKHALLKDEGMWAEHLRFDLATPDLVRLRQLVRQSIEVKQHIVTVDPREQGIRKALNLGHTVGHALESLAMEELRPVLHGYAVAWGLVAELYMSCALCGFPTGHMRPTVQFIRATYGNFSFTCKHYEHLYDLMRHDKKNAGGHINFTLLGNIGDIRTDCHVEKSLVLEALDFLREG